MLSLVVIAKDEADRLGPCLDSVPLAAEKWVLDSGSTDGTPEVARAHGARVEVVDWPGHVIQKNRALDRATQPWVLSLDADERLSVEAMDALAAAMANPQGAVGFSFPRCSTWEGRPIRHGRWYPDRKTRVLRRGYGRWGGDDPHDQLSVDGPVRALDGDIVHHPYRSMAEHLQTIDRYSRLHAASLNRRGVRAAWWHVLGRPPLHFIDAYLLRMGFLDGRRGLALAGLGAAHTGLKWARLWRRQHP